MKATNTITLLLEVGRAIRTRMEAEMPLSMTQGQTMRLLSENSELTMRSIARYLKITAPSATAIVNELVLAHLVGRRHNPKDRREVRLHLTPKGKTVLRAVEHKRKAIVASVLSVLPPQDTKQLETILGKILAGLNVD